MPFEPKIQQIPQIYNAQGLPVSLDQSQVHDAIASGQFGFQKGQKVPVVNAEGDEGLLPAEDVRDAITLGGYQLNTPELQAAKQEARYYDAPLKAGALGVARGLSLGLSDWALRGMGVDRSTLAGLQKYNPTSSIIGDVVGTAAPIIATFGAAAPGVAAARGGAAAAKAGVRAALEYTPAALVSKAGGALARGAEATLGAGETLAGRIGRQAIAKGFAGAAEGTMFAGGGLISESALDDRPLAAEHIAHTLGVGALIGLGVGAGAGTLESVFKKPVEKVSLTEAEKAAIPDAIADDSAMAMNTPESELAPKSIEDLDKIIAQSKYKGESIDRPEFPIWSDAEKQIAGKVEYKPLPPLVDAMKDDLSHQAYGAATLTEQGQKLSQYETLMYREREGLLNRSIKNISPEVEVSSDALENGQKYASDAAKIYNDNKAKLGPQFEEFKDTSGKLLSDKFALANKITDAIPEVSDQIRYDVEKNLFSMAPYKETGVLTKPAYDAASKIVKALNEEGLTLGGVRNLRTKLGEELGIGVKPEVERQITQMRRSLLEHIEETAEKSDMPSNLKQISREYAKNESNIEWLEKTVGGSVEGGTFGKIPATGEHIAVPEKFLDKIFRDSVTTQAAKEFYGEAKFKEMLAAYMKQNIEKMTDKGAFSATKFNTFLKTKTPQLETAFGEGSEILKDIRATTTAMRPLKFNVNPPNTAATLMDLMGFAKNVSSGPGGFLKTFIGGVGKEIQSGAERQYISDLLTRQAKITEQMAEKTKTYRTLKFAKDVISKSQKFVAAGVKYFLSGVPTAAKGAAAVAEKKGTEIALSKEEKYSQYQRDLANVSSLMADPETLVSNIANNTSYISKSLPETSAAISQAATRAATFLYSKAPKNPMQGYSVTPSAKKWMPSDAEMARFSRYAKAVNNPLSLVDDLKAGKLTTEAVEAVRTVYPKIHQQIVKEVVEQLSELKHDLPYQNRLQLSVLLGSPVDRSLSPDFAVKMQQNHAQARAQKQAQDNMASIGSGKKIGMSARTQTATERVMGR